MQTKGSAMLPPDIESEDTTMKVYMYGSLAESFDSMSVPWKGMVEFTDCGDLKGD